MRHAVAVPVIGIGAGPDVDGQILVLYDMLGITQGRLPRFVRNFMQRRRVAAEALQAYVRAVKDRSYPGARALLFLTPLLESESVKTIGTIASLREIAAVPGGMPARQWRWCRPWAICMTGHISLVELARRQADRIVVSRLRQSDPVRPRRGLPGLSAHARP